MTAPVPPGGGGQLTPEQWDHAVQVVMAGELDGQRYDQPTATTYIEHQLGPRP
jgi:hypothetical protein